MEAFVEFFTSQKEWATILEKIRNDPYISFYAGNNEVLLAVCWTDDRADL